jgi:plastocyanin
MTEAIMGRWVLLLCVVAVGGCGGTTLPPDQGDPAVGVVVRDDEFVPGQVTARVGQHVTWVWEGQNTHSLRFAGSPSLSAPAQVQGLYDRAFDTPGAYNYYCTIHGAETGLGVTGMSGRVTVNP